MCVNKFRVLIAIHVCNTIMVFVYNTLPINPFLPLYGEETCEIGALYAIFWAWQPVTEVSKASLSGKQQHWVNMQTHDGSPRGSTRKSALWADSFYKSKCPSVCPSVCSLLRYHLNVFLPPLPKVGYPIFLEIRNPWGKVMERSGLRLEHFCLEVV